MTTSFAENKELPQMKQYRSSRRSTRMYCCCSAGATSTRLTKAMPVCSKGV